MIEVDARHKLHMVVSIDVMQGVLELRMWATLPYYSLTMSCYLCASSVYTFVNYLKLVINFLVENKMFYRFIGIKIQCMNMDQFKI